MSCPFPHCKRNAWEMAAIHEPNLTIFDNLFFMTTDIILIKTINNAVNVYNFKKYKIYLVLALVLIIVQFIHATTGHL